MNDQIAYIGLGSNLNQPFQQIKSAIKAIDALPNVTVRTDSGYYTSKPMGPGDQPDFVNAVIEIETSMCAMKLLGNCQKIEQQQGRIKTRHWGERSIDLDILLFSDCQIESEKLIIPHPGVSLRDFVYMPLLKINPEIIIPGHGLLKDNVQLTDTDYGCYFAGNIE
ncbi:2-amino-4-hydroxy-6-hydroxymethyldihydropteridinepyrophosphokinase [hydrothermal vent metagenome]|uniref:2-amino-4-hydroxy-6-hydroxymethyldihydropteridine diphosphokinase n=1 Tax=hydrothermal vent metagenome TaxID=652676 RepID=A0A3B0WTC8_9ZZZZ